MPRVAVALLLVALGVVLCVFERTLAPLWMSVLAPLAVVVAGTGRRAAGDDRRVVAPPRPEPPPETPLELRVIEALPEPVLLIDRGRVTTANAAARALLGGHVIGESVRLAIRHPVAAEQFGRIDPSGVVELVGLDGGAQRLRMEVVTVGEGRLLVHLGDRSTWHAAERARVDFVANASHELRTPLASILGYVETLTDDSAGGDAGVRARFLGVTLKEARRMQRLIDDLISLSRIEAEKYAPLDARVAVGALARQVAAEQGDADAERRAGTIVESDDDLAEVMGDAAPLSQVLHNLLDNAFRYGRAPVTLRVAVERNVVRLSVIDSGDGIAADHVPRLTERFYRVDPSRSRSVGGTGLGLAIVKHIVERHRGRLDIVSRAGVGTTVSFTLPLAPPAPVMPVPRATATDPAVIKLSSN